MSEQYQLVSNKTSALHNASENLLQDQTKLAETCNEIRRRLNYFTQLEKISQRLQNPAFSVTGDAFVDILNTIDDCLDYLKQNVSFSVTFLQFSHYRDTKFYSFSPSSKSRTLTQLNTGNVW
jgi:conserved oligomeric Golgi complex subunit 3